LHNSHSEFTVSTFKDKNDKEWTLDINIDAVERVHALTGVSLYELANDKARPLGRLIEDLPRFAHVCYVLAGAEEQGVSKRDLATAIKGQWLEAMTDAFLDELILFFPTAKSRALRTIVELSRSMLKKATGELETINIEQLSEAAVTRILSEKSGGWLATSDVSIAESSGP